MSLDEINCYRQAVDSVVAGDEQVGYLASDGLWFRNRAEAELASYERYQRQREEAEIVRERENQASKAWRDDATCEYTFADHKRQVAQREREAINTATAEAVRRKRELEAAYTLLDQTLGATPGTSLAALGKTSASELEAVRARFSGLESSPDVAIPVIPAKRRFDFSE